MKLLFSAAAPPSGETEIRHSNFEDFYPNIHRNMAWRGLLPEIKQATRTYLMPWVGSELYDDIADKYEAGTVLSENQAEALELMQTAIALYTVYHALPKNNLLITAMGNQQMSDTGGGSNPPSQWAFKLTRWNALLQADSTLDQLLDALESYIAAEDSYFDLHKNSKARKRDVSDFFRSADQMDQFINIQGNRRAYARVVKYFAKAEKRYLYPVLGKDFYTEMKALLDSAATLTTPQIDLLAKIRAAVAEYGLLEAIPHLALVIDDSGLKIVSSMDGFDQRISHAANNNQSAVERLRQKCEQDAGVYLREMADFLYTNADDYPTWKNSDAYPDYSTTTTVLDTAAGGAIFL